MKKHVKMEYVTLNFLNLVKSYQIVFEMHLNDSH
jgi:hypothetical protein